MANLQLLNNLVSGAWAIDDQAAYNSLVVLVAALRSGTNLSFSEDRIQQNIEDHLPFAVAIAEDGSMAISAYDEATENSIAVIPVKNALTPEGYWGIPGTQELSIRIKAADKHENIKAIILMGDTPGGTVMGTEQFANVIQSCEKPVVGFVEHGVYSAGYWAFSGCNHIMLNGKTAGVGSIGTMISGIDIVGILEKLGAKEFFVVADDSPDKNKAFREMLEGKEKSIKEELLNPLNDQFKLNVTENRGESLNMKGNEPLTGKIYFGQSAIEMGLADSIGNFDAAVAKAYELAGIELPDTSKQSNSNQNSNMLNKFKALTALAAKQKNGEAVTAEDIQAVNDELQKAGITAYLVVDASQHQELQSNNEALFEAFAASVRTIEPEATDEEVAEYDLPGAITGIQGELSESQAEVEKLGSQAPKPIRAIKKNDGPENSQEEDGHDEFYSEADAEIDSVLNQING